MTFFRNVITYLAHWVSKDMVCPSNSNLEAIAECAPPQSYTKVHAFLGLVGYYWRFTKRFACTTQPISEYPAGKGASKKSGQVSLTEEAMFRLFKCWNKCAWPKMDWGQCCCSSRQTGGTTPLPMAAGPWHHKRRLNQTQVSGIKMGSYTLKSTCPTSHLWCGQIITHSCTLCQNIWAIDGLVPLHSLTLS